MRRGLVVLLTLAACAGPFTGIAHAAPAATGGMLVGIQADNQILLDDPPEQAQAMAQVAATGAQVLRITLSWTAVASRCSATTPKLASDTNACYDWHLYDGIVRDAHARGITLLASVSQAPGWANGDPANPYDMGGGEAQTQALIARYTAFLTAAATRYDAGSKIGTIAYWTIWNEPNSRTFWSPFSKTRSPADYADMVVAGAKAIRTADPAAKIAGGPTGPNSTGLPPLKYLAAFLPRFAHDGGKGLLDAWAHNPYPGGNQPPRVPAFHAPSVGIANMDDLFQALDASPATRGLPVWSTEFSYQTDPPDTTFGVTWWDQATWLAQYLQLAGETHRIQLAFWYVLTDPPPDTPAHPDWQSGFIANDGLQKPAFAMYERPIAVTTTIAAVGSIASIWGRSNLVAAGRSTDAQIVWSDDGGTTWTPVLAEETDGGLVTTASLATNELVAVRDRAGIGPARTAWALTPAGIADDLVQAVENPAWFAPLGLALT